MTTTGTGLPLTRHYDTWFLTGPERGNPDTDVDSRHPDATSWSLGNEVTPLVHGEAYFAALRAEIAALSAGDLLLFTDWRGDPDQLLAGPGSEIGEMLCGAAGRGVTVKGLIWRSHLDRLQFNASENRHLGEDIEAAGGECLLDMRVRAGGSHHQKLIVARHRTEPQRDVAFVGGIDLCHGRRDDARHIGDHQARPISHWYGRKPPWHDIQLEIRGPAVGDVEASFRERWCDGAPLSRNPLHRVRDFVTRTDTVADPLPLQQPDPPRRGHQAVQMLRTYPYRRKGYPFATRGERSVARAYRKALGDAEHLIYLEDQYLWSSHVASAFAEALERSPSLRMIAVVPAYPDQGGLFGEAQLHGREQACSILRAAGGDRFALYSLENHHGTPVYVHAKACVIDDTWTCVGSDNLNLRSWTHDSEASIAVLDEDGSNGAERTEVGPAEIGQVPFGRALRLALLREHLDLESDDDRELVDPVSAYNTVARGAVMLDAWHAGGEHGPRPRGRLRVYRQPAARRWTRALARAAYRHICDPDGRPPELRRTNSF